MVSPSPGQAPAAQEKASKSWRRSGNWRRFSRYTPVFHKGEATMSTKSTKSRGAGAPGNQGKVTSSAAYERLGARLGYIAGQFIDPENRAGFEQELALAVTEALAVNAPTNALTILDGFQIGYNEAKKL
jgi:hypothetical protein